MKRRDFLKFSAASGMALAAPVSWAGAAPEPYEGRCYVIFSASGGWDTTYLMDPKGGEINRLYDSSEILTSGNINYAPTAGRIASGAMTNRTFFEKYSDELLVINGIDNSVNNHSPARGM